MREVIIAHFHFHSLSSARQHGGAPEIYYDLHAWFDSTKQHIADARHRLILHNLAGVALAGKIFSDDISYVDTDGKVIKVTAYALGLQHLVEDFGRVMHTEEILGYILKHAVSKVNKFNSQRALDQLVSKHKGKRSDYIDIVNFFYHYVHYGFLKGYESDLSQVAISFMANSFGIFQLEKVIGPIFKRESDGREIPTRIIGENYVNGGYGRIPTLNSVIENVPLAPWMHIYAASLSYQFDNNRSFNPNIVTPVSQAVPFPLP